MLRKKVKRFKIKDFKLVFINNEAYYKYIIGNKVRSFKTNLEKTEMCLGLYEPHGTIGKYLNLDTYGHMRGESYIECDVYYNMFGIVKRIVLDEVVIYGKI